MVKGRHTILKQPTIHSNGHNHFRGQIGGTLGMATKHPRHQKMRRSSTKEEPILTWVPADGSQRYGYEWISGMR